MYTKLQGEEPASDQIRPAILPMEIQGFGDMKSESRKSKSERVASGFALRTSGFFRHSDFGFPIFRIGFGSSLLSVESEE